MTQHYTPWLARLESLVEDILSWEVTPEPLSKCSRCLCLDAAYRCTECWDSGPLCTHCIIKAHRHQWFHWVERWNGEFFERHDLASLGSIIYLGHRGLRCPNMADDQQPSRITITHTNGIHRCKLQYCYCTGAPDRPSQLIRSRLWPSSLKRPQSAFTIPLLRLHDHLWLISKVNANDFMKTLKRLTNNTFPETATVRPYSSFCSDDLC